MIFSQLAGRLALPASILGMARHLPSRKDKKAGGESGINPPPLMRACF